MLIVRDGPGGLEVLIGRRSEASLFLPGYWVFPGGRVEPEDGEGDGRWRAAAVREVHEEVGLRLHPDALVPFDRWLTPEGLPRRFDTVFFLAAVDATATPAGDAHEIDVARWTTPARLLEEAEVGLPILAFPTLAQVRRLGTAATTAEAVAACGTALPPTTITTIVEVDGQPAMHVAGADGVPRRFRTGPVHPNELAQRPPV
ncbi:NUDIX hydrolase [Patulibacter sp.]|uniref:NUDIX hydrolase n=1 Tax=Patulibacter sp. TaxID=1912859 RepID=UPI00271D0844|nr:NUDIX hydrolase [Patulibacter sp.]MDO9407525.1 NUDIX hydrolase [Patulibacter sp.]